MTDWKAEHDAELGLRREFSARASKLEERERLIDEFIARQLKRLDSLAQTEFVHGYRGALTNLSVVLAAIRAPKTDAVSQHQRQNEP